jgi:hypothetical protein
MRVVTGTGLLYHDLQKSDWAIAACGRTRRPSRLVPSRLALTFGERSSQYQTVDLPSITRE